MAWNDEELYNNLTNAIGADRSMAPVLPEPQPLPEPSLWDQFQQTSGEDLVHSFENGALIQPARGVLGVLRAAAENVGAQGAADAINEAINSETMQDYDVPNNVFSDFANAGGNVLGTMILSRIPYVGMPAALGVAAANTFGNDYNDLRKSNIDPEKAAGYAGADAAATAALEKVGLNNVFKGGGIGRSAVRGALSEGVTEGLQEFPNEIIPAYAKGEDIDISKVAKNAVYAGALAAPFGGLGGAASGYMNRRTVESPENSDIQNDNQQPIINIPSVDVESANNYLANTANTMDANTYEDQEALDRITDVLHNGSDEEKIQMATSLGGWEPPSQAPAMKMMSYLVNEKGYTPEAAAGIVGGFSVESGDGELGINPGAVNESSGAYGIAQWLPDRKAELDKFAEERGLDPADWNTQIQFVAYELGEGNETAAREGIMKAQNVDEAADLADKLYERSEGTPEIRQRKRAAANAVLNAWNQVSPSYGSGSMFTSGTGSTESVGTNESESTDSVKAKGFKVSDENSQDENSQSENSNKEKVEKETEETPDTYSPDGEIVSGQFDYIDDQGRPRSPRIDSYWKKINNTSTEDLYKNHPKLVKKVDDAINNVGNARDWLHTTQLSGQTLRRLGRRIHEGKRIDNNINRVMREAKEEKAVREGAFEGASYGNTQVSPQEQNVVDFSKKSPQLNITNPVSSGRERTSINQKEPKESYYRNDNKNSQISLPENRENTQTIGTPAKVDFNGQVDLSTPSERLARIPEYGETSLNDMFANNAQNVMEGPSPSQNVLNDQVTEPPTVPGETNAANQTTDNKNPLPVEPSEKEAKPISENTDLQNDKDKNTGIKENSSVQTAIEENKNGKNTEEDTDKQNKDNPEEKVQTSSGSESERQKKTELELKKSSEDNKSQKKKRSNKGKNHPSVKKGEEIAVYSYRKISPVAKKETKNVNDAYRKYSENSITKREAIERISKSRTRMYFSQRNLNDKVNKKYGLNKMSKENRQDIKNAYLDKMDEIGEKYGNPLEKFYSETDNILKKIKESPLKPGEEGPYSAIDSSLESLKGYFDSSSEGKGKLPPSENNNKEIVSSGIENTSPAVDDTGNLKSSVPENDQIISAGKEISVGKKSVASVLNEKETVSKGIERIAKEENKAFSDRPESKPLFEPDIIVPGIKLGILFSSKGINKIRPLSEAIINKCGERIRPWLECIFTIMDKLPKDVDLNPDSIKPAMKFVDAMYKSGVHDLKGILDYAHKNGLNNDNADKIIGSAYNGLIVFLNKQKGSYGKTVSVITDSSKKFNVRYKVVDSSAIIASQEPDGLSDNPLYDKNLQPRDRGERVVLKEQVYKMANNLDPERLSASQNLNQGAPIINDRNMVENGNGRTLSIMIMYRKSRGKEETPKYKQYLIDHAEEFGLNPEDVKKINEPILVRERGSDSDNLVADITSSTTGGARMGAVEQALVDAKKLSDTTLNKYVFNVNGDIRNYENSGFLMSALNDITTEENKNSLFSADGSPSAEGITKVKNALYAKSYENSNLLSTMAESGDPESKRLASATLAVAPRFAQLKSKIKAGTIAENLDVPNVVSEAVALYDNAHERGKNAAEVKAILEGEESQQVLFQSEERPKAIGRLASAFTDTNRKPGATAFLLNDMCDSALKTPDPNNETLFDIKPTEIDDIVNSSIDETYRKFDLNKEEKSLFGNGGTSEISSGSKSNNSAKSKYSITEEKPLSSYSDEELEAQVKQAHPNAENWKRTENGVEFDTPNGTHWTYNFSDGIALTKEEMDSAQKAHGGKLGKEARAQGKVTMVDKNAIVTLSKDSDYGTADHEAFHVAMNGALTEKETSALMKYANKHTSGSLEEKEEWLADDYKEWQKKRRAQSSTLMGKLYQKIQDFADKVIGMFRENRNNVYRKLSDGEIFSRKADVKSDKKIITKMSMRQSVDDYMKKVSQKMRGKTPEDYMKEHPNLIIKGKPKGKSADYELIKMLTTGSPSRSKNPIVRTLWRLGRSAMDTQTRLEREWTKKHADALKLLKTDEDVDILNSLNWEGDSLKHEFTDEELVKKGVPENVRAAYKKLRSLMKDIYNELNNTRTMAHVERKNVTEDELKEMKKVPFFQILKDVRNDDGTHTVTFNTPAYRKARKEMTSEEIKELSKDKSCYIVSVKKKSGNDNTSYVTYYSSAKPLTDRAGYIPHIFHEQMIACRKLDKKESNVIRTASGLDDKQLSVIKEMKDVKVQSVEKGKDGKYTVKYKQDVYRVEMVGSAQTLSEAVEKASKMPKDDGEKYFITPKELLSDFGGTNGVLVGDQDYSRIASNVSEKYGMSLDEARDAIKGVVKKSNKHRFNSAFLHRKGAEGFEEDSRWVVQQHIRNSARYIALEPFKYNSLSIFERAFGGFNENYSAISWAGWARGYINSILNQPMALEKAVNGLLEKIPGFKERFSDPNYGRGSRALAADITSTLSVAKLGVFNVSSAMLNMFQLNNLPGFIGFKATAAGMRHALRPNDIDKKVLEEANVESDVGLDSVDGMRNLLFGSPVSGGKSFLGMYSNKKTAAGKAADYLIQMFGKTMAMFSATEKFARRTAILGAYWKARSDGMNHNRSLEYARDVNDWVNFDYSVVDEPNLFRQARGTVLGDMALQFKKFPIKQLGLMSEFIPGLGTTGKSKSDMIKFWLPQIMITGLFGFFPGQELLMQIWGGITGDDEESLLKKEIMDFGAKNPQYRSLALASLYGIFGAVSDVDISRRVGMADVVPQYNGPQSLLGPTGSTAYGILKAFRNADPVDAMKNFSPSLGNLWSAYVGKTTDSKGNTTEEFDSFQRLLKAAGFRTTEESLAYDAKKISSGYKNRIKNERQEALNEYLKDPSPDNMKKLKDLNYTPKQIKDRLDKAKKESKERTSGNMSKQEKKDLKGVTDFLNG